MDHTEFTTFAAKCKLKLQCYSESYISVKETITVPRTGTEGAPSNRNKK